MSRVLGREVGGLLTQMHRDAGVTVHTGRGAGRRVPEHDVLLAAVGGVPATGWLDGTPLAARDGIPVDESARTCVPGIYAAGDCARPWDPAHGAHLAFDHWEAAARQGAAAARAILGLAVPAAPPRSFWSDQHGVRLQVLGEPALADRVVLEGDIAERELSARFHRGRRLVGALLVNRNHEVPAVRRDLLQERNAA